MTRLANPNEYGLAVTGFRVDDLADGLEKSDWISVLSTTTVEECRQWIRQMRNEGGGRGRGFLRRGTLLGIVEHNEVTGIVEIEEVMGEDLT